MSKKHDLPAMPFYVGDWLKCPEVRSLAPDHRGLWFDLICYMWESRERGVMVNPNGKPYSDEEIIRMVGLDNQNSGTWLTTLLNNGVCSRRKDGAIFSNRMVKDEEIRKIRRETGRLGGNPSLLVNYCDKVEDIQNTENENETENENINKDGNGNKKFKFDNFWLKYPNKVGRKMAQKHFESSVRTEKDLDDLNTAIGHYLSSKRVKRGFVQNGSTFFNNWRDWVDYKEESCVKCNDKGEYLSKTGYQIICDCPAGKSK